MSAHDHMLPSVFPTENNPFRLFVLIGALLGVGTQSGTLRGADATAADQGSFHSTLLDDENDLIFPSVIRAADCFEKPLAAYYLYTSPHRGADIRLYLADAVTGPWRLHGTVIDEKVGRAEHVSSPHAIWNAAAKALFVYVHAPNNRTIYCRSADGIHFEYGGICVTSDMVSEVVGFPVKSANYARVYEHWIAELANTYTMTLTASGRREADGRKRNAIVLCTSDDGITWKARRKLIDDGDSGHHDKQGLAILFFAARTRTGGSVFQKGLHARGGIFRNYTKAELACYHTSYFAIGKDGVPRGKTRLRKNPGANIMAEGASPIDGIAPGPHRIRVAKIGARILLEVDGELAFDWTDPGADGVAPYGRGQIGLRQMQHTVEGSYGYFRVHAIE